MPRPPPTARTAGAHPRASLTGRDLEALRLLAAGRSTAAIAAAMSVSTNTVRGRIHRLQNKLGAPARDQLVPQARALGLLHGRERPDAWRGAIPTQRAADHDPDRATRAAARDL